MLRNINLADYVIGNFSLADYDLDDLTKVYKECLGDEAWLKQNMQ